MDFSLVAEELKTRLSVIDGLRVFAYEVPTVTGETAFFGYPTEYNFDETYARGLDRMKMPLILLVPNPTQRNTVQRLAKYTTGSGTYSVKKALEDDTTPAETFQTVRVESIEFDEVTVNNNLYAGALFTIDITGPGEEPEEEVP